jgi:hypothetical protein
VGHARDPRGDRASDAGRGGSGHDGHLGDRGPDGAGLARVRGLLAWYPAAWRDRYGEEFAELLLAELAERPRSWTTAANVRASGLRCRLAGAGLAGHPLDPAAARRAGLGTLAFAAGTFAVAGACLWSQLAIALQWAVSDNRVITNSLNLMSAALLLCAGAALLAAAPVAWAVIAAARAGSGRSLRWPACLTLTSAAVLLAGGTHFAGGWPGAGGHLLAHQGFVPGGFAAFGWATTMWITSYWLHPAMLAAFSASQIAWMVICPLMAGCLISGVVTLLRRVELSARAFRYEIWLGYLTVAGMTMFLGAAVCWLLWPGGARPIFHGGSVDAAGLAVLATAAIAGVRAARQAGAHPAGG